jgi:molybdenum-dependent DNA-binding transcriptional regulator ModE
LVVREGNGSRLTRYAEGLMTRFENLQASILRHADEGYRDILAEHLTCSDDR